MDTITTIQSLLTCDGSAQSVTVALMPNDRRLIAAAPVTANACREALAFLIQHREAIYGIGHDIPMAAGATLLKGTLRAAIAAAEGGEDE